MIGWFGEASASDAQLDLLVGARTAPDAALEQPSEWEPELEPMGVAAAFGRYRVTRTSSWFGADGTAWLVAPEPDAIVLGVGPRGGVAWSGGRVRGEAAGRYDAQWYPFAATTSNGRAEAVVRGSTVGRVEAAALVEAVDRRYLLPEWSFRTVEPGVALSTQSVDGPRARIGVGWQLNRGTAAGGAGEAVDGSQLRATVELGWSAPMVELWTRYRLIVARGGAPQLAARPVFTPVGDYSDDVDALSAGGFLQHRVELGGSAELGEWTVRGAALGRVRASDALDVASFQRTVHGQVGIERELSDVVSGLVTVGCSGAELVSGEGYVDAYTWVGASIRPRPRDPEGPLSVPEEDFHDSAPEQR